MNINNVINKQRHIPKVLLCLSGLLALLIAAKVSAFVNNSEQIQKDITLALNCPGRSEDNVKKFQSIYTNATDALKKKNLFMPPVPPKKNPVTRVTAVLGDEACISNKWYEVGDKIGDTEITKISPNEVTIVWNNEESKLKPFDSVVLAAPPEHNSNDRKGYKDRSNKKYKKKPKTEQMEGNRQKERPQFSEEEHNKRMQKHMNRLTPEQRAKLKERMKSRGSRGGRSRGGRPGGGSKSFDRKRR